MKNTHTPNYDEIGECVIDRYIKEYLKNSLKITIEEDEPIIDEGVHWVFRDKPQMLLCVKLENETLQKVNLTGYLKTQIHNYIVDNMNVEIDFDQEKAGYREGWGNYYKEYNQLSLQVKLKDSYICEHKIEITPTKPEE